MDLELKTKKYKVIKNFIDSSSAKDLAKKFESYCEENDVIDDPQVPGSRAVYNYIPFLEILTQKTVDVSELIKETVLPTYCYARVYKNGNVLDGHTDRPSCEISLTVHLDGDKEWTIYMGDEVKEYITLEPGDAVLYLGAEIYHGRDAYDGEKYSQCFLHYVRSKGIHSDNYFDNKNQSKKDKTLSNSDFIKVYENAIPDELCDIIIEECKEHEWIPAITSDNKVKTDVRNCDTLSLSSESWISENFEKRKKIDDELFTCISNILSKYRTEIEHVEIKHDTGYSALRYKEGQFYREHTDAYSDELPRTISCSIILNDDYDGGEFAFFKRKSKFKLKKGSAIMFPSNFLFPHEILTVQKGTRYSIITWFV